MTSVLGEPAQQVVGARAPRGRGPPVLRQGRDVRDQPDRAVGRVPGPGISAVTSPTARRATSPSTSATTTRTPAAPTRSANQSWAARRHAPGRRAGRGRCPSPRTSARAARPSAAASADAGCRGRTDDGIPARASTRRGVGHRRGPSSRRRRVSARPSGESGRSHHDSTHQVAPASRPLLHRRADHAERAVAVALDDDVVALHRQPGVGAQRADAVDDLAQGLGGEVRVRGPRGLPPATAGKTPCHRAARSSERCRVPARHEHADAPHRRVRALHGRGRDELGDRPRAEVLTRCTRTAARPSARRRSRAPRRASRRARPGPRRPRRPASCRAGRPRPTPSVTRPSRQPVDRGDPRGEVPRPVARGRGEQGAQPDPLGDHRGGAQGDPGVLAPHGLPGEDLVPPGAPRRRRRAR